jgi:hypothetical protein
MQAGIQYYVPKAFDTMVSGIQDCPSVAQLQQVAKLIFVHPCIIIYSERRNTRAFFGMKKSEVLPLTFWVFSASL